MTWIVASLIILGSFFCLIAAIGVVRMPDSYMRMHAATKAGAFGASLLFLAALGILQDLRTLVQTLIAIPFFYMTAPVAAHLLSRAAIIRKVPLWEHTKHNELEQIKRT